MIYKLTIAPCGAMGTPFHSDTLFGHACWTIRLNENEERFKEFIQNAVSQKPELVFSDGFPENWFPRPLLPLEINRSLSIEEHIKSKKLAKASWVNFMEASKNGWNPSNLLYANSLESTGTDYSDSSSYSNQPVFETMLKNVIDRKTGTSLTKNGLYNTGAYWYAGIWQKVDIFVITEWSKEKLTSFIQTMFSIGYGRDQSSGMGAVKLVNKPEPFQFPELQTEWYLSLSHSLPCASIDLQQSFYQIETKYGKVWNALENQKSPFKKVLLQTIPGSVFKMKNRAVTAGRVLCNIHDNAEVIENCMTILYPLPSEIIKEVTSC